MLERLRRGLGIVLLAGLLIASWVSWHPGGAELQSTCVWKTGMEAGAIGRFLEDWSARHRGPAITTWGLKASPQRIELNLDTTAGACEVTIELGRSCRRSPTATLRSSTLAGSFPTSADLTDLAAGFPAPKGAAGDTGSDSGAISFTNFFPMISCLLLVVASLAPASRGRRWIPALGACLLVLVGGAAWPLFDAPFDTDAPVLRAAFAAVDIFGDWNHPFLPYLLNRPATWFSLEPRVLRVVPFLFLCAETALLALAATRDGGLLAGMLAGVWFACEVPRRHGLSDLGDWDFAGTFLVALLLWAQRSEPRRSCAWVLLALLLGASVFSSWLMIVPAGVLVGLLALESLRGRLPVLPVAGAAMVFFALAVTALRIFAVGAQAGPGHAQEVARGMLIESPMGRNPAMAIPAALGLVWLSMGLGRLANRFALFTLIAVPCSIALAFRWSHVNGGYYVGLVTPLLCYAAAVATALGLGDWVDSLSRARPLSDRIWAAPLLRGAVILFIGALTADKGFTSIGTGWEYGWAFAQETTRDQLPILTNSVSLPRLIGFERARAGEGPIHEAINAPEELVHRIRIVDRATCLPAGGDSGLEAGFYLVHFRNEDATARQVCLDRFGSLCRELQPPGPTGNRTAWFYRCDAPSPR